MYLIQKNYISKYEIYKFRIRARDITKKICINANILI